MVRLVGFFRALRRGSLNGDVGSERGCRAAMSPEVAGLGMTTLVILIVRFFGFRFGLEARLGSDWFCKVEVVCSEESVCSVTYCLS
jgi:hypothetical protein